MACVNSPTGANARFSRPIGLYYEKPPTGDSFLVVADQFCYSYRKITLTGTCPNDGCPVTDLLGTSTQRGLVDGTGADARFDVTYDIDGIGDGYLYVMDSGWNTGKPRIRKIDIRTSETNAPLVSTINLDVGTCYRITLDPGGTYAYFGCKESPYLKKVDLVTPRVVTEWKPAAIPLAAREMAVVGNYLYVADQSACVIHKYVTSGEDAGAHSIFAGVAGTCTIADGTTTTVSTGAGVVNDSLTISSDGKYLYNVAWQEWVGRFDIAAGIFTSNWLGQGSGYYGINVPGDGATAHITRNGLGHYDAYSNAIYWVSYFEPAVLKVGGH